MVSGIVPNCSGTNSSIFATFGRNVGEPVKIWDARKIHSPVGEIVPTGGSRRSGECVSAVAWSISRPGVLSIAVGNSIRNYDTSHGSRAFPVGVSYVDNSCESGNGDDDTLFIQCLAYQPQSFRNGPEAAKSASTIITNSFEFYPHRALAVTSMGKIRVIPESQVAPVAISNRDGRVANSLGGTVWIGPTTEGMLVFDEQLYVFQLIVTTHKLNIYPSAPQKSTRSFCNGMSFNLIRRYFLTNDASRPMLKQISVLH
jgi:hypothetical protein